MIAEVRLPRPGAVERGKQAGELYDEERAGGSDLHLSIHCLLVELGSHSASNPLRFKIIQRINHSGEVNRARYMPQKPDILATKTVSGEVHIFDRTKHESFESGSDSRPEIRLKGQTKEGFVSCRDYRVANEQLRSCVE
jgi:histone-binding protein RBBP4